MESHYYTTNLTWLSDRKGIISSPELKDRIDVVTPPQFLNGIEGVWSPEHFFVAAINSCIMTTFLAIADNSKLAFTKFDCSAVGKLEQVDGKFLMTEVVVKPVIVISDEASRERAERILSKVEPNCLISNSVKSKVIFEPQIIVVST